MNTIGESLAAGIALRCLACNSRKPTARTQRHDYTTRLRFTRRVQSTNETNRKQENSNG